MFKIILPIEYAPTQQNISRRKDKIMRILELDRINELARTAKNRALTAEELAERDILRQSYIQAVTGQLKAHLASVTVIDRRRPRRSPVQTA